MRNLAGDSKRSFWALLDQGVVSLGNFGVSIVLYKAFERQQHLAHYGDYWTLVELMLFLNTMQGALIVYPLTVHAAVGDVPAVRQRLAQSMLFTLVVWPALAASVLATGLAWRLSLRATFWACAALLAWQLQETTRRALMARLRFRGAIIGDSISYLGQVGAVAVLAHYRDLTLAHTFQCMALTSALAMAIQWLQVGMSRSPFAGIGGFAGECWRLGKWVATGNLSNFVQGPLFSWNMRYWVGDERMAIAYAISNLLRPANPLSFAIASVVTPVAARAKAASGLRQALHLLLRYSSVGAMMLWPYLLVLVLLPKYALAALYGWNSQTQHWALLLQISAAASAGAYIAIVTGAFLNGVHESRLAFMGQMTFAAGALFIGMPATALLGIIGAAIGFSCSVTMQGLLHIHAITRLVQSEAASDSQPVAGLHVDKPA